MHTGNSRSIFDALDRFAPQRQGFENVPCQPKDAAAYLDGWDAHQEPT